VARRARGTGLWRTNVILQIGLLKEVKPRAMTRDIDWGIPCRCRAGIDNPHKRLYVWFDAVIGYLSASIEWARRHGDPDRLARVVEQPGHAVSYYFMGKDNITFHSQIWPPSCSATTARESKGGEPGEYGELTCPPRWWPASS
jgi:methionyl-tRNA synthetase